MGCAPFFSPGPDRVRRVQDALSMTIRIRKAVVSDLEQLKTLPGQSTPHADLVLGVQDRCVLVAQSHNKLLATVGIDLDRKEISGLYLDPEQADENLGSRLICRAEKLAVQFGIFDLRAPDVPRYADLLRSCRYREESTPQKASRSEPGGSLLPLQRSFVRRHTRYSRQAEKILTGLRISLDYGRIHRIPLQQEASKLKTIGPDIYQREQKMLPRAANAWVSMIRQAEKDGIQIQAVSAFRSVSYQAGLLRRKLDKGQVMEEILRVSAAPGFSEHHTGRAIDVTTPGYPDLEEEFESSPAFGWLQSNAADFNFHMSFPKNNRHKVASEPWHWAWRSKMMG